LNWLYVGASEGGGANNQNVVVDLSEHAVTNWNWSGSLTKTSLSVTNISIGSAIATGTSGSGKGGGTLFLPSSLTNIWCSQFALGYQSGAYYLTNTVNLGTNSGAIAFTVASSLKIGVGSFLTLSGPGGSITNTAFPMGSTLTIGSPSAPATVCQIGKGYSNSMVFGRGFTNVAIYCANHTVGGGLSSAVKNNVNNDFRDAVNLTIVATNALQLGINSGDIASMYVPANSFIACSNVVIGANSSSTYSWYLAALYMSNTAIAVSNSITLNPTAIVTNYINGISSGFDIGTTNFTVAGTNFGGVATQYGRINLVFVSDPINPTKPYWGLRLKGDARSWLPNLTNAPTATTLANNGYLSWSTAGLSASARSRFGIQYDGVYTYVGVSPTSGGMTMFFW